MMFVGPASCGDITEAGLAEAILNFLKNILNFRIHPLMITTKLVREEYWYIIHMKDVSQFMHLQQMTQSWYNNPICHVSVEQFLLKQQLK